MYCSNCGRELSDSTKFCPYCGTRLAAAPNTAGPAAGSGSGPAVNGGGPGAGVPGGPTGPNGPNIGAPGGPGTDPGTAGPAGPGSDGPGRKPKKRRWLLAVALVVLALVLGLLVGKLAGGVVAETLWSLVHGTDDAAEQSEDDATTVYYCSDSDGAVPAVLSSTTIVFYSADGEELEEYDLYLMDGAGALTHCHVDAETGPFTPGGWDIAAGSYRLVVREPETNTVHTLDRIAVVDEDDGEDAEDDAGSTDSDSDAGDDADSTDSDSDADDDTDYTYYDDELNVKPDPDDSDSDDAADSDSDGTTSAARQAAYALYYERALELQELYGEAALDSAGEYLSGLAFVGLVDLVGDEDGIEELVLVYNTGSDAYSGWILEVWRYDADSNDIEPVCEKPFGGTGNADMVITIYDCGETAELEWSYWAWENRIATVTTYAVRLDGDSLEVLEAAYTVDYDADEVTWLVDGTETDQDAYNSFVETMRGTYSRFDSYSVTAGDAEDGTTYDPTDTLAYTQETIGALQLGMMDLTEDELCGTDGKTESTEGSSTSAATYSSYYDYLMGVQERHGEGAVATDEDGNEYCTGLCFAVLLDFNGDGADDLFCVWWDEDDAEDDIGSGYGSYATTGSDSGNLLVASGWLYDPNVRIGTTGGRDYFVQHTISTYYDSYYVYGYVDDEEDGRYLNTLSLLESTVDGTLYRIDDVDVTEAEFLAEAATWMENTTVYPLMYLDGDYSALAMLEKTLTFLEAYAEE